MTLRKQRVVKPLKAGTDYTVKWANASSKNVGKYSLTVTGKGKYTGTTKAIYEITKASNSLSVKGNTVKIKKKKAEEKGSEDRYRKGSHLFQERSGTDVLHIQIRKEGQEEL